MNEDHRLLIEDELTAPELTALPVDPSRNESEIEGKIEGANSTSIDHVQHELDEGRRTILAVAAKMLGYPGESFSFELDEIMMDLQQMETLDNKDLIGELFSSIRPLGQSSLKDLQELYVTTFDWKEDTGLYLTAIELGDSRDRGAALILLQRIIADSGYELEHGELSDYIPALYELLATAPYNVHLRAVERRLAVATKHIHDFLPAGHPYKPMFGLLIEEVFGEPTAEEIEKLTSTREKTDLEDMPYPILYGMDEAPFSNRTVMNTAPCKGMGD